jgi:hypothetical protein
MFIHHHLDTVQTCLFLLEEDTWLSVLRAHLENHIKTTKIHVSRKYAEFVFNGDELGFADWEYRTVRTVIVPIAIRKEDIYHSMFSRHHHITLLACVSVTSETITPRFILVNPIRLSLWSKSVKKDEDVMVRRRSPAYVNENLFFEYISTVFVP